MMFFEIIKPKEPTPNLKDGSLDAMVRVACDPNT